MAAVSTSTWISFFKDAGIPAGVAATYALTFSDNRIQMDMLLELNKEYLRDMGITLMGDVIAILRHAKRVHEQTAREKILGNSSVRTLNLPQNSGNSEDDRVKNCTSAPPSAILKKITRGASQTTASPIIKKKVLKTKITNSPGQSPELKKIRRVLPEHEGRYKITMPSGSTPRTKEILAKMKTISPPKKTVFDRLGSDGLVTSTTETESPRITITGLGNDIVKTGNEKHSSVFLRLGEKSQVPSSTTITTTEKRVDEGIVMNPEPEKTLPYVGILKSQPKNLQPKNNVSTMHADKEPFGVIKKFRTQFNAESNKSIRLTRTAGILGNRYVNPKTSVKSRLGLVRAASTGSLEAPTTKKEISNDTVSDTGAVKKRVTFGGVSRVYPQEQEQFRFQRFRSDFNNSRGARRGGVFNRLSL